MTSFGRSARMTNIGEQEREGEGGRMDGPQLLGFCARRKEQEKHTQEEKEKGG